MFLHSSSKHWAVGIDGRSPPEITTVLRIPFSETPCLRGNPHLKFLNLSIRVHPCDPWVCLMLPQGVVRNADRSFRAESRKKGSDLKISIFEKNKKKFLQIVVRQNYSFEL